MCDTHIYTLRDGNVAEDEVDHDFAPQVEVSERTTVDAADAGEEGSSSSPLKISLGEEVRT